MNEVGSYIAVLVAAALVLFCITAPSLEAIAHTPVIWGMGGYLSLCAVTYKRQ